jgi:7-carboxy-7-deazaguanine synthase
MRQPIAASRPGCLRVTEEYLCLEGEGSSLGAPTWLIRLSGCDLRCWWCDSKQSSFFEAEAREQSAASLASRALKSGAAWVSLTGGEPLWRGARELAALASLLKRLKAAGRKVKVETNGRHWLPALDPLVSLWSVAPKWDSRKAGAARRSPAMDYDLAALKALAQGPGRQGRLQIKFVITGDAQGAPKARDLAQARSLLKSLVPLHAGVPVYLTPAGGLPGADYLQRNRLLNDAVARQARLWSAWDVRVAPQWHRVLYGDERKK